MNHFHRTRLLAGAPYAGTPYAPRRGWRDALCTLYTLLLLVASLVLALSTPAAGVESAPIRVLSEYAPGCYSSGTATFFYSENPLDPSQGYICSTATKLVVAVVTSYQEGQVYDLVTCTPIILIRFPG